jgi:hypothetical protein
MLLHYMCLALSTTLSATPHASGSTNTCMTGDTTEALLTTDALTGMTSFWTAFMQEPDSVKTTGRQANQEPLSVDIGSGTPVQLPGVVNMAAMATKFPSVAADLQRAHLTAQQWEQNRAALVAATLAAQQGVTPAASSLVGENMAFLQAHPQEFQALRATGMWFPKPAPQSAGGPTTLAAVQAQDQAQTAQLNQFVASRGPLASPRDTARATIGSAHVLVDYGRPSKRGRVIFGDLVPYGQVWRTGANPATTLVTDKDLMIGTQLVPAGTYTLYTIPSQSSWQLVINKEVGQWGLVYHQEYDLGRVPMTVSSTKSPVEKFLIDFSKGTMRLQWDTTVVQVPIAVKK